MTNSVIFGTQVGILVCGCKSEDIERGCMQLTMTGEYAVRAMLHLASLRFGSIVQISDISKQWDIPDNFLRKITAQLASAGLIASLRGLGGGITLARPADMISLLEVIEAAEGKLILNKCLLCDARCPRDGWCAVHLVWNEAQMELKKILGAKTIAQLAAQSAERRAAVEASSRSFTTTPQYIK